MSDSVRPQRRKPTRLPHSWDSPGKNTGVGCHFFLQCMKVKSEREVSQSCPTLSDPMDCSLPGSSAHGIFQVRVLEWGAIAFSICIPEVVDISPGSLNPSLWFIQPGILHDVIYISLFIQQVLSTNYILQLFKLSFQQVLIKHLVYLIIYKSASWQPRSQLHVCAHALAYLELHSLKFEVALLLTSCVILASQLTSLSIFSSIFFHERMLKVVIRLLRA